MIELGSLSNGHKPYLCRCLLAGNTGRAVPAPRRSFSGGCSSRSAVLKHRPAPAPNSAHPRRSRGQLTQRGAARPGPASELRWAHVLPALGSDREERAAGTGGGGERDPLPAARGDRRGRAAAAEARHRHPRPAQAAARPGGSRGQLRRLPSATLPGPSRLPAGQRLGPTPTAALDAGPAITGAGGCEREECACAARLGAEGAQAEPLLPAPGGRRAPAAMARRVVKGLLLLEAAGLLGALLLYRAMDRSRDFRYTMQKRFPSILEVYYKSNEWSGIHGIRENDQMAWLSSKN
ncbi:protein CEBPZOS isoform X2 [Athene noctua]|uniref:protein CEBPZOS isoform X2 n=1 Tax=Athene noctua TaxID=126797 RepID=UPI003EB8A5AD